MALAVLLGVFEEEEEDDEGVKRRIILAATCGVLWKRIVLTVPPTELHSLLNGCALLLHLLAVAAVLVPRRLMGAARAPVADMPMRFDLAGVT